ncbi:MAG: aquaporin [Bacteroidetes bacterium]|nr:aquaporin [Bacteroidota bacterium]
MRPVNIKTREVLRGIAQLKISFRKNYIHYLQEALGLAIFMVSACFFSAMLEAKNSSWHLAIPDSGSRNAIMGLLMGATALFIFYSPFTAPSGSHINPAVTVTFFRLGKMEKWDSIFYILFQVAGGLIAVYVMAELIGKKLTAAPVNYATTVPGKYGTTGAAITEFMIAFLMMTMILFTTSNEHLKKYTRIISGCFVCVYVIVAGPISGFGMNPARTAASAVPAHIYTSFWVYMIMPFAGMLTAAEVFVRSRKKI